MRYTILLLLIATSCIHLNSEAQSANKQLAQQYRDLQLAFDSAAAYKTTAYVESRWRLAGNTGFDESIRYVETILQKAGYKKEVNGENDAILTYRIETRPLRRPSWDPIDASLTIVGASQALLQFSSNKNMLAINSASTPAEGVEAEVVFLKRGTLPELDSAEVKGKIVFAESNVAGLYDQAVKRGAIGVLAYSIPSYNQSSKHVNSISFQSIALKDTATQKWGLLVSYAAREALQAAEAKGPVRVRVMVKSRFVVAPELTIVANIRGSVKPDERFVFSAHVQEPGANDNASGVGALAEMARVSADFVRSGKLKPKRTITFLWGDEIVSTARYIKDDSVRAKGILWGMSLDMVGEDTKKTGGTFLIEKMPDPSAVWTRGEEKHSEWGGSPIKESEIKPHYFNDFVLNRCIDRAKQNGWVVKTNPFEGGSDHTPFLQANKPGLLMWHFTDVFYHTDGDRIDKVSAWELKNVGIAALVAAYTLVSADEAMAVTLIKEIEMAAVKRLDVELALSLSEVAAGKPIEIEQHILETWSQYYVNSLGKMIDIRVGGETTSISKTIATSQGNVKKKLTAALTQLSSARKTSGQPSN